MSTGPGSNWADRRELPAELIFGSAGMVAVGSVEEAKNGIRRFAGPDAANRATIPFPGVSNLRKSCQGDAQGALTPAKLQYSNRTAWRLKTSPSPAIYTKRQSGEESASCVDEPEGRKLKRSVPFSSPGLTCISGTLSADQNYGQAEACPTSSNRCLHNPREAVHKVVSGIPIRRFLSISAGICSPGTGRLNRYPWTSVQP